MGPSPKAHNGVAGRYMDAAFEFAVHEESQPRTQAPPTPFSRSGWGLGTRLEESELYHNVIVLPGSLLRTDPRLVESV